MKGRICAEPSSLIFVCVDKEQTLVTLCGHYCSSRWWRPKAKNFLVNCYREPIADCLVILVALEGTHRWHCLLNCWNFISFTNEEWADSCRVYFQIYL